MFTASAQMLHHSVWGTWASMDLGTSKGSCVLSVLKANPIGKTGAREGKEHSWGMGGLQAGLRPSAWTVATLSLWLTWNSHCPSSEIYLEVPRTNSSLAAQEVLFEQPYWTIITGGQPSAPVGVSHAWGWKSEKNCFCVMKYHFSFSFCARHKTNLLFSLCTVQPKYIFCHVFTGFCYQNKNTSGIT
jgi:hypothetical protein